MGNCRTAFNDREVRMWIEWYLRLQRTAREMTAGTKLPTDADVRNFYQENRHHFQGCAVFEAAHIVKHIDERQDEKKARTGIETAMAEIESGGPLNRLLSDIPIAKAKGSSWEGSMRAQW